MSSGSASCRCCAAASSVTCSLRGVSSLRTLPWVESGPRGSSVPGRKRALLGLGSSPAWLPRSFGYWGPPSCLPLASAYSAAMRRFLVSDCNSSSSNSALDLRMHLVAVVASVIHHAASSLDVAFFIRGTSSVAMSPCCRSRTSMGTTPSTWVSAMMYATVPCSSQLASWRIFSMRRTTLLSTVAASGLRPSLVGPCACGCGCDSDCDPWCCRSPAAASPSSVLRSAGSLSSPDASVSTQLAVFITALHQALHISLAAFLLWCVRWFTAAASVRGPEALRIASTASAARPFPLTLGGVR